MPGMDGVLTKEVNPDIKIIILTTFDDDEFIYSASSMVPQVIF